MRTIEASMTFSVYIDLRTAARLRSRLIAAVIEIMGKENFIETFFFFVVTSLPSIKINPLVPSPPPPPTPPPLVLDVEMQTPSPHINPDNLRGVVQEKPDRLNPDEIDASDKRDYDLAKIILGFSFPAAIALLVLSHQTEPHLPSSFHLLSFAVWLAFSASLVGILLHYKFLPASKVLMNLGIVSAAIAFSLLMAILLPTYLEWLVWAFCVILSFWFFYGLYGHVCAESSIKENGMFDVEQCC